MPVASDHVEVPLVWGVAAGALMGILDAVNRVQAMTKWENAMQEFHQSGSRIAVLVECASKSFVVDGVMGVLGPMESLALLGAQVVEGAGMLQALFDLVGHCFS